MENKNGIGRIGLIALIVSSCIGTGIFGITNAVAAAAAPGPALLAWLFVGFGFARGGIFRFDGGTEQTFQ